MPRFSRTIALLLVAAALLQADVRAIHWNDLAPLLVGHKTRVSLMNGSQVSGKGVSVGADALVLQVAAGQQSISRDQVKSLDVAHSTVRWRIVGTSVGAVTGVPLGVLGAVAKDGVFGNPNSGWGIFLGIAAGMTAAGYFIGWAADRHKTTIMIVP